jgi:hypothetical protein
LLNENEPEKINGVFTPDAASLVSQFDKDYLCDGKSYFIHGDLQPDNILYSEDEDRITLIDWRHEFSGSYQVGDIYYDFAKLLAGIRLNYDQIKKGQFSISENKGNCDLIYKQVEHCEELVSLLKKQAEEFGCSFDKIELLSGLVYLNMSPLHRKPFGKLLNCLGRQIVYKKLKEI